MFRKAETIVGPNVWVQKNDFETLLRIENDEIGIQSIVDTKFVSELQRYKWLARRNISLRNEKAVSKWYICGGPKSRNTLHRYIMDLEYSSNPLTVDHINRNTLDNRLSNLRWLSMSEQNQNTDKRVRKYNAQSLPESIKELPKFVTYNTEIYNKNTGATRDFFRIEKHPQMVKTWSSSKSTKLSIHEKLDQVYRKLNELDSSNTFTCVYKDPNILAIEDEFVLKKDMIPKYVNYTRATDKHGGYFEIAIPDKSTTDRKYIVRRSTKRTGRVSLRQKYDEMKAILKNITDSE